MIDLEPEPPADLPEDPPEPRQQSRRPSRRPLTRREPMLARMLPLAAPRRPVEVIAAPAPLVSQGAACFGPAAEVLSEPAHRHRRLLPPCGLPAADRNCIPRSAGLPPALRGAIRAARPSRLHRWLWLKRNKTRGQNRATDPLHLAERRRGKNHLVRARRRNPRRQGPPRLRAGPRPAERLAAASGPLDP